MTITKRDFLSGAACITLAGLAGVNPVRAASAAGFAPKPGNWRHFEVETQIDLSAHRGPVRAWVPIPSFSADDWMRPGQSRWSAEGATAELWTDPHTTAALVQAAWPAGAGPRKLTVTSPFSSRDRAVDLEPGSGTPTLSAAERAHYTAPTALLPLDGIVAETAAKATEGAASDLDKARAIYEWVVENTFRDPETRGCGLGDIRSMLLSGNLGGKCADLNALYVGLARAAGLAARDVYGIRVAPSAFGYKSLGAGSPDITKAQHCRAEVFVDGVGWIPVDPADVRKVALQEPPGDLPLDAPQVRAAREALFGSWETNWLAYNDAHDIVLPGSQAPALPFLMYPQAETEAGPLDPLAPDDFTYAITAREIDA